MRCTDAERRLLTSTLLPNGVRLSCGAELECSQTEDYLRKRGAVSFRRLLGRGPRMLWCNTTEYIADTTTNGHSHQRKRHCRTRRSTTRSNRLRLIIAYVPAHPETEAAEKNRAEHRAFHPIIWKLDLQVYMRNAMIDT